MREEWKAIKDYEGIYEVSNRGRVKSLERTIMRSDGKPRHFKEIILKQLVSGGGYYSVFFYKNKKRAIQRTHILVWVAFGDRPRNGLKLSIDHINGIKTDNRIENLQLLTHRENISKGFRDKKTSSKYTGVSWDAGNKIWRAQIQINRKDRHLGCFDNEYDAHLAYQKELRGIINGTSV